MSSSQYTEPLGLDSSGNLYVAVSYLSDCGTSTGTFSYNNTRFMVLNSSNGGIITNNYYTEDATHTYLMGSSVDSNGNLYVVAETSAPIAASGGVYFGTVPSGETPVISYGSNDALVKFNSSGSVLWKVPYVDAASSIYPDAMTMDSNGNIYVVGTTDGSSSSGSSLGYSNASGIYGRITKYDSSGGVVWGLLYDYDSGYTAGGNSIDNALVVNSAGSIIKAVMTSKNSGTHLVNFAPLTPPSPTNVTAACQADNLVLSWKLPTGYDHSYVRVYDETDPTVTSNGVAGYLYQNSMPGSPGGPQAYTSNTWSGAAVGGHTYSYWVHTSTSDGNTWSVESPIALTATVTCVPPLSTPPTISCNASDTITMSWTMPTGYDHAYVRVYDETSQAYLYQNTMPGGALVFSGNTWSGAAVASHQYAYWVHVSTADGNTWSTESPYPGHATGNPSVTCPALSPTGTLLPSPSTCSITSGNSCNVTLTWNTVNPGSNISAVTATGVNVSGNSGSQAFAIPYTSSPKTFYLYNNGILLAQSTATATIACASGTAWNGSTCASYTVSPSVVGNGTISPSIAQTVAYGATTSFTVTPSTGYSASVGGNCGGTLSGKIYTTNPITNSCTVIATFNTTGNSSAACGTTHYNCTPAGATSINPKNLTSQWTWNCQSQDKTYTSPTCTQNKTAPTPIEN
jgi:hypothetical protein